MAANEETTTAARLLAEAFDALSVAAVIIDQSDQIIAVSLEGQRILDEGKLLQLNGALECHDTAESEKLRAAICSSRVVGLSLPPELRTIQITTATDSAKVTVAPLLLNRDDTSMTAPTLLIIERIATPESAHHSTLRDKRLTPAEIQVAALLLQGNRMAEIAARRRVSIETVRSQVKTIYSKLGVSNQVQLLASMQKQ